MSENNATEQRILKAAEDIFLEKGFKQATMMKIAERAEVTHTMLHYYFRTKEQLFIRILDKNMSEMFTSIRGAMGPDLSLWDILKNVISLHFDFLNSHRQLPYMLLDIANNYPELLVRYKETVMHYVSFVFERHREMIRKDVDAGRINDVSADQLLYSVLSQNVFAFLSLPALVKVFGMPEGDVEKFLEDRKADILRSVYLRLYGKVTDTCM